MNAIHPTCCQSLHHSSIPSLPSSLSPLALPSFLLSYPPSILFVCIPFLPPVFCSLVLSYGTFLCPGQ